MPSDERLKSAERCTVHPGSPSVARCDGCGRPLCLSCAVPIRGRILGSECLAAALGHDVRQDEDIPSRAPWAAPWALTGAGFALSVLATILPWTRFGEGSGLLGAWGRTTRWSVLATVAAVLGLGVWFALRRGAVRWSWVAVETALGAIIVLGAVLAIVRPPPFTRPWIGPWFALGAGLLSCAAAWTTSVRARERRTTHV